MKVGWHSVLEDTKQVKDSTSFIGGKPCLPPSLPLPKCTICGAPLTFFFQVEFPAGHMWFGKSLAFFYCTNSIWKHNSVDQFPPQIHASKKNNFIIPFGSLAPEKYQTLFRAYIFDTVEGKLREDYPERVAYHKISWKKSIRKNLKTPIILGGEPIWTGSKKFGQERPILYDDRPMDLILQIADYFNFDHLPDAPAEMKKTHDPRNPFVPRSQLNYTLFHEFNRVYLWGTTDFADNSVYLNVQNDV